MGNKDKIKDMEPEMVEAKEVVREIAAPIPSLPVKRFTFEQWASQAGVKESHKSGLRAFCKSTDKLRTMEEWYKIFEKY